MNPFDLRGPEFLLFYLILSAAVLGILAVVRRISESNAATKIDLADPYLIASLRGGDEEVLRVALVSLIDRGLLIVNGTQVTRAEHASTASVRRDLEKQLIEKCAQPREATALLYDSKLLSACAQYQETLKTEGLLPDQSLMRLRWLRFVLAALILGGTGGFKIIVALQRGRTNVTFLIIMMIAAIVIAAKLSFPRLTAAGAAMLSDVQNLYSGLRGRAMSIHPGGASLDAMMLAAAFGVGLLEGEAFAYTKRLFPRAQSAGGSWSDAFTSSCGGSGGSSCGSSCGGGGCGGGCGGCGS